MMLPPLDSRRARELVHRFDGLPVLVVGDVMLDRFIVGQVTRISPEAPVPVVQFQAEHVRLGGAANVAHNLAALGARVSLVGVVGADEAAGAAARQLAAAGIRADGLVEDRGRPTAEKVRIVTDRNQQVARVDYEHDADISGEIERTAVDRIGQLGADAKALLVSDYLKGTITRPIVEALLRGRTSGGGAPLRGRSEDSASRLLRGRHARHAQPSRSGDGDAPAHPNTTTRRARRPRDFRERAGCEAVLITRGEHGMWLSMRRGGGRRARPSRARSRTSPAPATRSSRRWRWRWRAGATFAEAAVLANHAAGDRRRQVRAGDAHAATNCSRRLRDSLDFSPRKARRTRFRSSRCLISWSS